MATKLSPGVFITERDSSVITPTISNNIAFFAGDFEKGQVDVPFVITNKQELEDNFGRPTDENFNQYFQAWKFLDYANQLIITRAYEETVPPVLIADAIASDAPENVHSYDTFTLDPATDTATFNILLGTNSSNIILPQFQIGDILSFDLATDLGKVTAIKYVGGSSGVTQCKIEVTVEFDVGLGVAVPGSGDLFLHSVSHKNGETQAVLRGDIDPTSNTPLQANAVSDGNIDQVNNPLICFANTRLSNTYDLIKNDNEWDFEYSGNDRYRKGIASFGSVETKLKFFSRTPSTEKIEIAIANWYDFLYESNTNKAIAFQEVNNGIRENTYLTDLFQYYPNENQIAVMVKRGSTVETFIVGFDEMAIDGNNKSTYIETVINDNSNLVYVLESKAFQNYPNDFPASYLVCDRFGLDDQGNPLGLGVSTKNLTVQGGKSPKITVGALRDAYFSVEDKEKYEIDVVIGNESHNQNIAIELAETRKDTIAYVGARYEDTVGKKANDATNAIIDYLLNSTSEKLTRTMFAAFFGNYFRIYDNFNKKYRWINCAGDAAGIRCSVSTTNSSWWVSAGMRRGKILGVDRMAFTPSLPQRDNMYKNGINPLVTFPGTGHLVWGNKTLQSFASSFDRINVRAMFNTLERAMAKAAKSQVFEFNDPFTRNAMLSMFNPYLASVKAGRGLTEYLVVCNEENNPPDVISRNELRVDIYLKPNFSSEFIVLNFINTGTRSFSEVIGA
jgi:hypothetical protein